MDAVNWKRKLNRTQVTMENVRQRNNPGYNPMNVAETFKPAPHVDIDETEESAFVETTTRVLKALSYIFTFLIVLVTAVTSRASLLLMTSQLDIPHGNSMMGVRYYSLFDRSGSPFEASLPTRPVCNESVPGIGAASRDRSFSVSVNKLQAIIWTWVLLLCLVIPECFKLLVSIKLCIFKPIVWPTVTVLGLTLLMEGLHAVGCAWMTFGILPKLNVVHGAMLANCVFFVPAVIRLSHSKCFQRILTFDSIGQIAVRVVAAIFQFSGLLAWSIPNRRLWGLPISLILVSCGWWENFIGDTDTGRIARFKEQLRPEPYEPVYKYGVNEISHRGLSLTSQWVNSLGYVGFRTCSRGMAEASSCPSCAYMTTTVFEASKTITNTFAAIWKSVIFLYVAVTITGKRNVYWGQNADYMMLFTNFTNAYPGFSVGAFQMKNYVDSIVNANQSTERFYNISNATFLGQKEIPDVRVEASLNLVAELRSPKWTPLAVGLVHVFSTYVCYSASTFACQICIQQFSMAFPLLLGVPFTVGVLGVFCALQADDSCFTLGLPGPYFYNCPPQGPEDNISKFLLREYTWVWLLWMFSQTQVTSHIWRSPRNRMSNVSKLFVNSYYCPICVEQSMMAFRRRDDPITVESDPSRDLKLSDRGGHANTESVEDGVRDREPLDGSEHAIVRIIGCATMWHETEEEMVQLLKSIFRMNVDQCSVQRNDPDYYELEAEILFDDAFVVKDGIREVNEYVKTLIRAMDIAVSKVYGGKVTIDPPCKLSTPYGGRLEWELPSAGRLLPQGKNRLLVHLKDKKLIRARKRWSQVMYMYYLLGYCFHELNLSDHQKELRSQNTFLLALDGDINFRPHAVKLLVDLMKNNPSLGAACGRIHPVGSGLIVWYQKFEYAVGHWLQKATEHTFGCVLCSPGCFSLFRAGALMADGVMRTYTMECKEPQHYVQYDQGEDRWLCTLLLQRGFGVEYSAASDAYTHAPEAFEEFFTQRRRWGPSTLANVIDLLLSARQTIEINPNISVLYIMYQSMLMIGNVIGPGNIFMMMVGSFVTVFSIAIYKAMLINLVPLLLFILVCFFCNNKKQILLAQVLSFLYALVMTAVLMGIVIQIKDEGLGSPSAMFFVALALSFIVTALLHPRELLCILHGVLYFLLIPAMYLFLTIYSVMNLHVVVWGTREKPPTAEEEKEKQAEQTLKKEEKVKKSATRQLINTIINWRSGDAAENKALAELNAKVDKVLKVLDLSSAEVNPSISEATDGDIDTKQSHPTEEVESKSEFNATEVDDDAKLPLWKSRKMLEWKSDPDVLAGPDTELAETEVKFWEDMLNEFLKPPEETSDDRTAMQKSLIELRNNICSAYFMLNALYILALFFLQINKDSLFMEWPFGGNHTIQFVPDTRQVTITRYYLHLDPIGLGFVVFFAVVMFVQFLGMLLHRLETFKYILAFATVGASGSRSGRRERTLGDLQRNAASGDDRHSLLVTPDASPEAGYETLAACDEDPRFHELNARNDATSRETEMRNDTIDQGDQPHVLYCVANHDRVPSQAMQSSSGVRAHREVSALSASNQTAPSLYQMPPVSQHYVSSNGPKKLTHDRRKDRVMHRRLFLSRGRTWRLPRFTDSKSYTGEIELASSVLNQVEQHSAELGSLDSVETTPDGRFTSSTRSLIREN